MFCNYQIHDELKNMNEPLSPFCDHLTAKVNKAVEPCCSVGGGSGITGSLLFIIPFNFFRVIHYSLFNFARYSLFLFKFVE